MIARESLEKIIIVADHQDESARRVVSLLHTKGFNDVRTVNGVDAIYEQLKPFHDQPDKIGLLIINEQLPHCGWLELCQRLTLGSDSSAIPCIVIGSSEEDTCQPDMENALFCRLSASFKPEELMLAAMFLLKLKQERFLRHKQEEQLINELAAKSIVDAKLKFLVAHDELTGLFNRSSFERQFRLVLNLSNKLQKSGALLFIDVDRFSLINELEGFEVGDRLLVELTLLVRKLAPAGSLFARIGADEFCLFLENKNQKQAIIFAETIKTTVENFRFFTGEVSYGATVSIGIASLDNNSPAQHPGEMILHARQACNFAKRSGRDKIRVYNSEDVAVRERRNDIYWVPLIRKALRENDLILMFQPVVQLNNGTITHYEVLLRMRGENDQIISPDKFIPAAERMGLIHAIDLWVVENAIEFLAALPSYMSYVSLAINLSGTAFQYPDLLQVIRDKLELTWVDASRLTFEITETAAVDNFDLARNMISKIRSLGCKFALDDFGAGFCSFNYLKTFPVDYVKIDGQFIQNLVNDETDQILVKSMVEIAAKLGKQTIAEFVETPNTALKLKEIGVNLGQGYAFGRPERNLLESQRVPMSILLNNQPTIEDDTIMPRTVKQHSDLN